MVSVGHEATHESWPAEFKREKLSREQVRFDTTFAWAALALHELLLVGQGVQTVEFMKKPGLHVQVTRLDFVERTKPFLVSQERQVLLLVQVRHPELQVAFVYVGTTHAF